MCSYGLSFLRQGKGFGGMKAILKAGDDALKGMKAGISKAGDYAKKVRG